MVLNIPQALTKIMLPKRKGPPRINKPTLVAFDIEDYGIERSRVVKKGKEDKTIRYKERFPLAITCALFGNDGKIVPKRKEMFEKWNFVDLVEWVLECLEEENVQLSTTTRTRRRGQKKTKEAIKTLYLISHFSVAEFRHIRDWEVLQGEKGGRFFVGRGDVMHLRISLITSKGTVNVRVIDSFAYFMRGLKNIASFVGLKKISLDNIDGKKHKFWIEHMDQLLQRYPKEFWEYAEFDSIILLKAFKFWRDYFQETFKYEILSDWTPTIASVSADIFRINYLSDEKGKPLWVAPYDYANLGAKRKVKVKVNGEERDEWETLEGKQGKRRYFFDGDLNGRRLALYSYWGGRREAFVRGYVKKKLAILDFKAHYNRCGQSQPLPMEKTRWIKSSSTSDFEKIIKEKWEGFAFINFKFPDSFEYPCLPVMSSEQSSPSPRLMFPTKGKNAYVTLFELRVAKEICPQLQVEIHKVRAFIPTQIEINNPLRRFLKKLEGLKNEAQREKGKNSIEYHASKLMGNSIVGKFAQKVGSWSFEDTLTMYETLRYDREALQSFLAKKRGSKLKTGSTWCPEWSSLILGRARALLGLAFAMTKPYLGHTDSLVIEYDPETIAKTIEALKRYDAILEIETDKNGKEEIYDEAWILRASVYVFFKDGKAMKSARHGYPTSEEDFVALVEKNLKEERSVESQVQKWSIVKPSSSFKKNLPLGSDILRETTIDWKWDFKREIANYVRDYKKLEDTLLWTSLLQTKPYKFVKDAVKQETRYLNKRKGIPKRRTGAGRPKKKVRKPYSKTEKTRLRVRKHRQRKLEQC